ncbi:ATP-binding protein [Paraphotobacterium marinum]|uniref:hybrid sensor histidine kinase/response regulator n=1 Tax=Paraphotobacterium marinum TaxID=1755811 RepID=UPI0039EAB6E1
MKVFNNFSIKTRLLIILVLIIFLLGGFYFISYRSINKEMVALNTIEETMTFNNKLNVFSELTHAIRLNVITKNNYQNLIFKNQKLLNDFNDFLKGSVNNYQINLNEYIALMTDSKNLNINNINDWSQWRNEIIEQTILLNELVPQSIESSKIIRDINSLNQLRWLMYWAQEENWYIFECFTSNHDHTSPENIEQLKKLINIQEYYIERFVGSSTDAKFINEFLEAFKKPEFVASFKLRNQYLKGEITHTPEALDIYQYQSRFNVLKKVVTSVEKQITDEVIKEIESLKKILWLLNVILLLSIFIAVVIILALTRRIIKTLKYINNRLAFVERTHDYGVKLELAGKDEFNHLTNKLNQLIMEVGKSEKLILRSKNEAEKANRAKSNFLANMSHEIRTPLHGILGMTEVLLETSLERNQKEYLDTVISSSKHLLILINDILDLSKIEAGNVELVKEEFNFTDLIYENINIMLSQLKEKQLKLNIFMDKDLPVKIYSDHHRLSQIIINLLSNAIKFTSKGGINIELLKKNKMVILKVIDTGIGIDDEKIQDIFKPFNQGDNSITKEYGGTGLGLAISKQIIELMKGRIEVKSKKDHGTTFKVFIPLESNPKENLMGKKIDKKNTAIYLLCFANKNLLSQVVHELKILCANYEVVETLKDVKPNDYLSYTTLLIDDAEVKFTENIKIPRLIVLDRKANIKNSIKEFHSVYHSSILGEKFRNFILQKNSFDTRNKAFNKLDNNESKALIMVVEDNLVNQKVTTLILKNAGFDFIVAENGQEAIQMYSEIPNIKIILMDCMMPILDGFEATKAIRKLEKTKFMDKVPIIALTASVMNSEIQACFRSGMDDYLAKPFTKAQLIERLEKYF